MDLKQMVVPLQSLLPQSWPPEEFNVVSCTGQASYHWGLTGPTIGAVAFIMTRVQQTPGSSRGYLTQNRRGVGNLRRISEVFTIMWFA